MADQDRFCFLVEWYEEQAARIRQFLFTYYVSTKGIEMYCIKTRKTYLKTSLKDSPIELTDLYIGSTLNILGRQIVIKDYGDVYTRNRLSSKKEKTLGVVKPDAVNKAGQILDNIYRNGFQISQMKMCRLDRNEAFEFYQEHKGKPFLDALLNYVTSGPVIALELVGENAIQRWRDAIGPTDPTVARSEAPNSIRSQYGTDKTMNACHGSDSPSSSARELEFFFPSSGPSRRNTAVFQDSTCCIIKPHAVKSGVAGKVISGITDAGFEVTAIEMFHMQKANAEEFYEVYKGVVQEYNGMVAELTSGPCIALEVRAQDAPKTFREMAGPADPEIARHLRPRTLRALFGTDKVRNAVHCTDLPEDGLLEVEYFFKILGR
ncbi:nucleoside diphosphate kinase homolog 7-like [Haliotis cracherodii]|uniref:nucleoside diphosphate kinase homolog 7-like n=1 Tax=Haliotis cracherodii TaxID=6455 RepID=UPI0039EBEC99